MNWKLATFNVNGVRARMHILLPWLAEQQPDVLCLQEIKCQDKDFPAEQFSEAGYEAIFQGQKSYNGVAILSRQAPREHGSGFNGQWQDDQARLIWARHGDLLIVNTYVPQGRDPQDPAFTYKLEFFNQLRVLFGVKSSPDQKVIWCGDINVAPQDIDLYDPEALAGAIGCHPDERAAYQAVLDWGFSDVFRRLHPDKQQFTFWDYRLRGAQSRGLGWRIDHILATGSVAEACVSCWADEAPRRLEKPSDHTPLVAEFDF